MTGLVGRIAGRGPGRDPGRGTLATRGAVLLVAVALVCAGLVAVGRGALEDGVSATVLVDDPGGALVAGGDVKYQGVIVGKVTGLRRGAENGPSAGQTRIDVRITPETAEQVPENVHARVLPATVFGVSFVDLVAPDPAAGHVTEGAVIPPDQRRSTLELQRVLDGLDSVIDALGPAALSRTLESMAAAVDGNGERLGRLMVTLRRYLARLNPEMDLVRENLDLLATNLEAFRGYAPDLLAATEDTLVAARTLAEEERAFQELAASGQRAFTVTEQLLSSNEERLAQVLARTAVAVDVLFDHRGDLAAGVRQLRRLGREFAGAIKGPGQVRVDGELVRQGRGAYGPGDCPDYGGHPGRGC